MATAIRKHLRDFLAVAGLAAVALAITYILLQEQRLRLPIFEEKPFELKAEFETAQAVTPGPGPDVVVAGVKIGDISKVELQDGKALVTMDIERKFLPIYRNATAPGPPADRAAGRLRRARPRGQVGRRLQRGRHDPGSPTPRPRSTSTRSSRRSTPTRRPICGC